MRWWNKAIHAIPVLFCGWSHTAYNELLRKPVHSDISLTTWANGGVRCRNLQSQVYLLSGFVKLNILELKPDVLLDWKSKEYKNWNYKSQWHAGASKDIMSISGRTDLNQKNASGISPEAFLVEYPLTVYWTDTFWTVVPAFTI